MDDNPPGPGRPKKDSSERRSERVTLRFRPACLKILDQEADRRSTQRSLIIEKIGFEQIEPQGRAIPPPIVFQAFRRLVSIMDEAPEQTDEEFRRSIDRLRGKFLSLRREVGSRVESRKRWWNESRNQAFEEVVTLRLKPRKKRWVKEKASEQDHPTSSFLRHHVLLGVTERSRLEEIHEKLQGWIQQVESAGEVDEKFHDRVHRTTKFQELEPLDEYLNGPRDLEDAPRTALARVDIGRIADEVRSYVREQMLDD